MLNWVHPTIIAMFRNAEFSNSIQAAIPQWVVNFSQRITHLGDYGTVVFLGALAWMFLFNRNAMHGTVIVTAILGSIALVSVLKFIFVMPRPPRSGLDGYGMPSGHALVATVTYGLIADAVIQYQPYAWIVAVALIFAVSSSRVIIGAHYPSDVVVGMALGGGVVSVALSVLNTLQ